MKSCLDPKCRRKDQLLPLTDFYRDNSRRDGYAYICKECKSRRASAERLAKKDPEVQRKPCERVYLAVRRGSRTREQIGEATKLDEDVISDALAELWDIGSVKIERVRGVAVFVAAA